MLNENAVKHLAAAKSFILAHPDEYRQDVWNMCIMARAGLSAGINPIEEKETIAEAIGLTLQQFNLMWYESYWPKRFRERLRSCVTSRGRAKAAADRIDHFVEHGE